MNLLFSDVSIFEVLQHQQMQAKTEVGQIDPTVLEELHEQELVRRLASKYKLELQVLADGQIHQLPPREVDIDVSQDPVRLILDRSHPLYVKGTEITIVIPFMGNVDLFRIQPETRTLNPPRGEIRESEIHLTYRVTDNNAARVKPDYEQALLAIRQHLTWLETSVERFNESIGSVIQGFVSQRTQLLSARARLVSEIGLLVRQNNAQASKSMPDAQAMARSINSSKKWDVFISHASEDKEALARPLAFALQLSGLTVWFDKFALRLGDSLRGSIDYGLANSRYGVVILSQSFFAKYWPAQELNGLASREVNGKKVLLPVWHNVTFEEVRDYSPILADRFAAKSDQGLDAIVNQIKAALET